MMLIMMTRIANKTTTMRILFGYHYQNPVIIVIVIMALVVGGKLPPVVNGHTHRWRNSGYDVIEEEDFDEGSTDSAYRMTSYEDDDDDDDDDDDLIDMNFDPDLAYLTRCQKQQKSEKTYNVSCLEDGSFNSSQCHMETMDCWCVDHNGDYIQDSIRKLPERTRCLDKVRPTFTLILATPSRQPSTISTINRHSVDKVRNKSANQQQSGHADPVPSEVDQGAHLHYNHHPNRSRIKQNGDDDGGSDDDDVELKNNHNDDDDDDDDGGAVGGLIKGHDDEEEDEEEDGKIEGNDFDGGDDDDDDVTQQNSKKLLRRDPVYTTGLILVILLSSSIVIIMAIFFIHRFKRKDEGSYTLASNAIISTIGYSVSKDTEYFA